MAPIRLGLMTPLSGLVELWGEEISNAGKIAVQKVNDEGGLLGRRLELILVDDGSQPDTAVPAARDLVLKHHCHGIIGNLLSNSRIAVNHEVATPLRVPYLNFSFYEGSIFGPYYFNFSALPNQQIDLMVPYMAAKFGNKFFFAGSNYEWPRGSIYAARHSLEQIGGVALAEEYFEFGTKDFSGLLEQVKKEGTDVFIPYFAGQDQIELLTQFHQAGLKDKVAVVMGHYDEVIASHLPPEVRAGLYSSNTYFMTLDNRQNREYLQALAQLPSVNGIWPKGNGILTNFGEGTYACVMAFAKAVELAGSTEADAIAHALKTITVQSIQGRMTIDPKTQHASVNCYLSKCNLNGCFDIVESFGIVEPKIPARYKEVFSPDIDEAINNLERYEYWRLIACFSANLQEHKLSCLFGDEDVASLYFRLDESQHNELLNLGFTIVEASLNVTEHNTVERFKLEFKHTEEGNYLGIHKHVFVNEEIQDRAINSVDMSFIVTDLKGFIIQVNSFSERLFGYGKGELLGVHISSLIPPRFRKSHAVNIQRYIDEGGSLVSMDRRSDLVGYRRDGSEFPLKASIGKLEYYGQQALTVSMLDISEQKCHEAILTWRANHDALTRLPNKKAMYERITHALEVSKSSGEPVVVLFLDLDGFKIVNDSYGHTIGDRLLIKVSDILLNVIRAGDTVARFGGDEFLILMEKDTSSPGRLAEFIDSVNEELRKPVRIDDIDIQTSVSIGMALGSGDTHTAEDLIRNADTAMYSVKDKGRDGWTEYDEELYKQFESQRRVATGLVDALSNDEFVMYYQPIVDLKKECIIGAEALCRWPLEGKMVSPAVFIPVAETTGQIHRLGLWTLTAVCRFIDRNRELFRNGQLDYISVNVSAYQIQDIQLPDKFEQLMQQFHINPDWIVLEITETAMMKNLEGGLRVLHELGKRGFRLAIDDFGTGYSSLGQLIKLPVQKIKIDKVFIDHVADRKDSQLVVKTIQGLAHGLNLKIIAEGVETSDQFKVLSHSGIDYLQGYLFHKPLPEDEFVDLVT